jgi:hypothetical protein
MYNYPNNVDKLVYFLWINKAGFAHYPQPSLFKPAICSFMNKLYIVIHRFLHKFFMHFYPVILWVNHIIHIAYYNYYILNNKEY